MANPIFNVFYYIFIWHTNAKYSIIVKEKAKNIVISYYPPLHLATEIFLPNLLRNVSYEPQKS